LIPELHYSLAFQGGGAKGIAYVGAYRALIENKHDSKSIPLKSIMGSSAGGIIALAISTGINPIEVEHICYTMNQIPSNDRFDFIKDD
jgi:predicted acylesterase/phospholipase RssA